MVRQPTIVVRQRGVCSLAEQAVSKGILELIREATTRRRQAQGRLHARADQTRFGHAPVGGPRVS